MSFPGKPMLLYENLPSLSKIRYVGTPFDSYFAKIDEY